MLMQVLFQILQHTPVRVFGLFFALLALGYMQSKPREIGAARLALLPLAFGTFLARALWIRSRRPAGMARGRALDQA